MLSLLSLMRQRKCLNLNIRIVFSPLQKRRIAFHSLSSLQEMTEGGKTQLQVLLDLFMPPAWAP